MTGAVNTVTLSIIIGGRPAIIALFPVKVSHLHVLLNYLNVGTASHIEEAGNSGSLLDASQDISKVPTRFIILDSIVNAQMSLQPVRSS